MDPTKKGSDFFKRFGGRVVGQNMGAGEGLGFIERKELQSDIFN